MIAPIALLQALAPVTADDATIVNITSDAAVEPYEGWGGYGASKAALEHASRILAAEQPSRRVLVVDPGDMRTEMHRTRSRARTSLTARNRARASPASSHSSRATSERTVRGAGVHARRIEAAMIDTTTPSTRLDFVLDAAHEAHEPPEAGGGRHDDVRLLVSVGDTAPVHARFTELGAFLAPGDLLVVNTSATVPAAVDGRLPDGDPIVVHFSGDLPGGALLVEVRQPDAGTTAPRFLDAPVEVDLFGAGRVQLLPRFAGSRRLWLASAELGGEPTLTEFLAVHGRPIRYRHVPREWPLDAYQTVFAREPGSVEMPTRRDRSRPAGHRPGRARRRDRAAPAPHRGVVPRG